MGERKTELKTFRVDRECDVEDCDGVLIAGVKILLTNPPQYPHTCSKCGCQRAFIIPYPATTFEPV